MPNVFISYSRENQQVVDDIINDIEELGYHVWFDKELTGGQNWWNIILEEIRLTDIFIFILSPESRDSVACIKEYTYAYDLRKAIIPLLISNGISTELLPPRSFTNTTCRL